MIKTIDDQIKEIIEKHNAIISADDSIHEIQWKIEGLPYAELNEWRRKWNEGKDDSRYKEWNNLSERLYVMLFPWDLKADRLRIDIYSLPVKFKHTYQVVEEIETV